MQAARLELQQKQSAASSRSLPSKLRAKQAATASQSVTDRGASCHLQHLGKQNDAKPSEGPPSAISVKRSQLDMPIRQPMQEAAVSRPLTSGIPASNDVSSRRAAPSWDKFIPEEYSSPLLPQRQMASQRCIRQTSKVDSPGSKAALVQSSHIAYQGLGRQGDQNTDDSCVVCMEAPAQMSFQPCGHAIACKSCAEKICAKTNECPLCRSCLQGVMKVSSCSNSA